jgi:hypothetical protein
MREPASTSGPPFRVVSSAASEDFPPLTLPPPSEPFLFLSPDSVPPGSVPPFQSLSSQDTLSSPFLSDSALRVESVPESQGSAASLASEAETVSGVESDEADSTQAELPLGQFQLAKSRRQKRRRPEAERLAAGSPLKPADAKRMVSGRLASPDRRSLELFSESQSPP